MNPGHQLQETEKLNSLPHSEQKAILLINKFGQSSEKALKCFADHNTTETVFLGRNLQLYALRLSKWC